MQKKKSFNKNSTPTHDKNLSEKNRNKGELPQLDKKHVYEIMVKD